MRVFLVAGELSGDILGATLMRELKRQHGDVSFRGIGGPRMIEEGLESLYPLETLSIMGLVEVLRHLPRLVGVRRHLRREAQSWPADIMIGIDAPDFNLGLEAQLRSGGMTTAHYVSPSVWAWRQGRVKKIRRAVDMMLTFLPFEAEFYERHDVPVQFVGHPLAEELPLDNDRHQARRALGLSDGTRVLAVLPGSRSSEIAFMAPVFLEAIRLLRQRLPALEVVIPAASPARREELMAHGVANEGITIVDGRAWEVMTASDAVLLTSGTSALEAMLCHRPMVVAYRMAPMTWQIARRLVKTRWISLPNLIAQESLVPELIQDDATGEAIAEALVPMLESESESHALSARFVDMHRTLQRGASARAARVILDLMASPH
ncbi:lipid-A-disaccharide synthase [Kushneria marisflavi]|uniref:Lipid-A-disaccharide synthase n=1 Tax=Kushneria marisflavi TaxID=157779 RepID=A0A240UQL2_9GAMM|nr:lipid-A-disaccharide synthase [Kushneria marisflavi]ART63774.1 lipid-A-disaccharide synthase [Kushneria marisflavi]RKD85465.1 lipid-A-disaccharide synthase [Kushneria marisflavi]